MNLELEYKTKIKEIKDKNKELQLLDLDCINYEEVLEKIEEVTSEELEEAHQKFNNSDQFLTESLNVIYGKALKRLDVLNDRLTMEYEYCYKQIMKKCRLLNKRLDNQEENEIQNIITDIQKLLFQMKKMPTINYDENRKLVEEVYELVYRGIKLELGSKIDSQLLEKIKTNTTDISYVAKLIKEDISKESDKSKQKSLERKVQELNQNGSSDIYYLNKDLIIMLISKKDDILISQEAKQILEKIKEYENTQKELEKRKLVYSYYDEKIPTLKSEVRKSQKKIKGRKIALAVNLGLIGGLIMAVSFISKPEDRKYKTSRPVYDSSIDNISPDTEYLSETENTVTVAKYQPWEEYGISNTKYKRNVYPYKLDVLNMNYDDIKDYLTSDLKEEVKLTKKDEKSEYVIAKQIQNKDNNENLLVDWGIPSMFCALGFILYNVCGALLIGEPSFEELKILKKTKTDLKWAEQGLLDYKELVEKFYNEVSTLKRSIEVEYDQLPIVLKENKEIKRKVLAIKEEKIEK